MVESIIFFFRLVQNNEQSRTVFSISHHSLTFSSLKLLTGLRQGVRAPARQEIGNARQRGQAQPRLTSWLRAAGGGDGKAARQFSARDAKLDLKPPCYLRAHWPCGRDSSCLSVPGMNRLGWTEPDWAGSPLSPVRGAEGKTVANEEVIKCLQPGKGGSKTVQISEKCSFAKRRSH